MNQRYNAPGDSLYVLKLLVPSYIEHLHDPLDALSAQGGTCVAAALLSKAIEDDNGFLFRHINEFGLAEPRKLTHFGCLVPAAERIVHIIEATKGPTATSLYKYGLLSDCGQSSSILRDLVHSGPVIGLGDTRTSGSGRDMIKTTVTIEDPEDVLREFGSPATLREISLIALSRLP